jgi:phytoene dehydrogenase-like protein
MTDPAPAARRPRRRTRRGCPGPAPADPRRRGFLAQAAGAALLAPAAPAILSGCSRADDAWRTRVQGRWIGADAAFGHRVRDATGGTTRTQPRASPPADAPLRRCDVLVVGAGIAGLAAARALRRAGVEDIALLELEAEAGGNSRGGLLAGQPCPLGAHYLPLPGPQADDVRDWLVEIGLARPAPGGPRWDERHLCHSLQERLFIDGRWQEGLLPDAPRASATQAQYRRFAQAITQAGRALTFAIPTARAAWTPAHAALDAVPFTDWLREQGIADARLLAYLDYCCRDDYGAGSATVSAWAGVHYFESRHGFAAPGDEPAEQDALLTWPDGNAPLARALRAPLGERVRPRRAVFRIDEDLHGVDAWAFVGAPPGPGNAGGGAPGVERWRARQVVVATPLFIAARLLSAPPAALVEAARMQRHAPWLVANLRLDGLPLDRAGAPLAWDNVVHGSASLGYVDAQHQALAPVTGDRVWTVYWALPEAERGRLLAATWQDATARILAELHVVHPDLGERLREIELVRHGHAMSIPAPGVRSSPALAAVPGSARRVHFGHADLSAYSVFEEAFTRGDAAGRRAAAALKS